MGLIPGWRTKIPYAVCPPKNMLHMTDVTQAKYFASGEGLDTSCFCWKDLWSVGDGQVLLSCCSFDL